MRNQPFASALPLLAGCLLVIVLLPQRVQAQYPFEKYQPVQYRHIILWQKHADQEVFRASAKVSLFNQEFTVQLSGKQPHSDTLLISISVPNGQHQQFIEPWYLKPENLKEPVRVADLNGDGLLDLKLVIGSLSASAVPGLNRIIYLYSLPGGKFIKISFLNFYDGPERDFNGDHQYELIVKDLKTYKGHSYWVFNVFSFRKGKLENVGHQYRYPILVQLLNRPNFNVTDKVSIQESKQFWVRQPREYDWQP